ncbi:MAG: PD-(D/E)XK nuclease family transposase [Lachnospiraceae bacterium]|nr:PD-(D/E)XK nuclease family transposase [Lachnospiraceae bacterium]
MSQLKNLFPLIREREEILAEIEGNRYLSAVFRDWTKEQQEHFLEICTGVVGAKILSDSFFKEIMNPEYTPGRMERFLANILKQNVKILQVLPNESTRIASEVTLLETDIVVELQDGSIVNVEIQRIGYKFPGERAACYSADMLLRQYKRVREARGKKFVYKDVKPVYTIVLFEKSPAELRDFPEEYIHYFEARSNTGLKMDLLQKFVFVSLDNFMKRSHNKIISDELEAWLTLFTADNPVRIEQLIREYPEFKAVYDDVYAICLNTERLMGMFSKELRIIDENTVQYMIDELQEEVDEKKRILEETNKELEETNKALDEKNKALDEKNKALDEKNKALDEKDKLILQLQEELRKMKEQEVL